MNLSDFKKCPVLGILRGITEDMVIPVLEAAINSGLRAIEITMNTDHASRLITIMAKAANGRLAVGAGTVLTKEDLDRALDAGATFIVSPVLIPEVAEVCVAQNVPFFPGALTPQEIYRAWQAGATMVKVFPANQTGPRYFKEIKGPFNDIELLACGGVDKDTVKDFFLNKASAVAFGGGIFRAELLKSKNYKEIERLIRELIAQLPAPHAT